MLTTKYVRDHLQEIKRSLEKRRSDYPLDELMDLDEQEKKIQKQVQELRTKRNKGSLEVSELRKAGKKASHAQIKELSEIKRMIDELEVKARGYESRISELLWNMPNILHESVPYGRDSGQNVEIRRHGAIERKGAGHEDVLKRLDLLDLEQAAKVSGARFYYLKGDLALLENALVRFAIDNLMQKGYTLVSPPFMLKKEYYRGATALGDFEEALYMVGDTKESEKKDLEKLGDELFLISTSEHPLAAMVAGRVFSAKELPKRYAGVSPCFRREAGSHGKDTKGIFRVHQFYKVEQFVVSRQEDSWAIFEELIGNAEELFRKLEIPYRVVDMCTAEIGTVAARKYDIEAYMPAQDKYREVVSCSNCTDWQALRLDIKYDEGERKYAHTLNSTAVATTRTIVAIIENYLNEKGSINIPDALVPYMNGKHTIG